MTPTLLRKIVRHPGRAVRRLVLKLREFQCDPHVERRRLLQLLERLHGVDARELHDEFQASGFRYWYETRKALLARRTGPLRHGTSHDFDCETLYIVARALRPEVVVETGVLYGASSAHILAALERNGRGRLHSIDLGNPPDEPPNDFLVPDELRSRWTLIVGDSRALLEPLLTRLGGVDWFHHDSLHTHEHMRWEYETARAALRPGGMITTHDLLTVLSLRRPFRPHPFRSFCAAHGLAFVRSYNTGVAWLAPQRAR